MRFETEMASRDVGRLLPRFFAFGGIDAWERRWTQIDRWMEESPFLVPTIKRRYGLELALRDLRRRLMRQKKKLKSVDDEHYNALALAMSVVRIHRGLSVAGRARLSGVIRDSLKSRNGFTPFGFEVAVATDLISKGFDVKFVDLEGEAQYDFLITKDSVVAEVECKSVSYDLGRKIHRHDFERLAKRLYPSLMATLARDRNWNAVLVELEDRLPSNQTDQCEIVRAFEEATTASGTDVSFSQGRVHTLNASLPGEPTEDRLRELAENLAGNRSCHELFLRDESGRWLLLIIYSEQAAQSLREIYRKLSGASKQLSGERVGILFSHISEISPSEWHLLRSDDTGLTHLQHRPTATA